MIASFAHRFVFIHVPKNAGTALHSSIKSAFASDPTILESWGIEGACDLAHPLPATLNRRHPAVFELLMAEETVSFALLRDPVSRCLAAFREHRAQYGAHSGACNSLEDYLDRIEAGAYEEKSPNSFLFIHGAPQRSFIYDDSKRLAKYLFRLDDPLAFMRLSVLLGRPLLVQHENTSPCHPVPYLSRKMLDRIAAIYEGDYDMIDSTPLEGGFP